MEDRYSTLGTPAKIWRQLVSRRQIGFGKKQQVALPPSSETALAEKEVFFQSNTPLSFPAWSHTDLERCGSMARYSICPLREVPWRKEGKSVKLGEGTDISVAQRKVAVGAMK